MTVITPTDPVLPPPSSRLRTFFRGARTLVRRAPLSAFWGLVAALIVIMSVSAPEIGRAHV